jgi:iron complex transport system substrate-binding protein
VVAVSVVVAVGACSDGGDDDGAQVTPAMGGMTPIAAGPTAAPTTVTMTDDLGREVELPAAPERVVAMSPSIVELLFAVGVTPAGRPDSAEFPAAASGIPSFGTSYEPNYEEIVALEPDLIIADAIIQAQTIEELADLGVPVFAIRVGSFEDVTKGLRLAGEITGNEAAGEEAAAELEDQLEAVLAKVPSGEGPSVLVIVGAGPGQIFAARNDSYVGDLIARLGGENVVTTEPDTFRLPGFSEYSLERIVETDPDVILALSVGGPPGTPKTSEALAQTPVWSNLSAVKEGRVAEIDPVIYLQAAGPRVSIILDELSRILYPSAF